MSATGSPISPPDTQPGVAPQAPAAADCAASPCAALIPDYRGGSIANLTSSIAAAFGAPHAPCPTLHDDLDAVVRQRAHVALLVVDGLGLNYLQRQGEPNGLRLHLRGSLTSVFPSTTASAITTLLTGLAPAQHALTGWHVYFEEIGAIGAVLPDQMRGSKERLTGPALPASRLFAPRTLFSTLPARAHAIAPKRILDSTYNVAHSRGAERHAYTSLQQYFQAIEHCLRNPRERTFVYAYWPELDSIGHEHGIASRQAADSLRRFERGFGRLLAALAGGDVTVLVTGDHGMLDADPAEAVALEAHPGLAQCLRLPLCGERRVAYCYVHEGRRHEFERYVANHLAERAALHSRDEVLARGWLGTGAQHPALASRIGDYVLVMRGRATIKDWLPGEKRYAQIGVHGGLTADEMRVPLIVAQP